MAYLAFFFFFQAEDGIRDYKVTGAQTFALPITCRRQKRTGKHNSSQSEVSWVIGCEGRPGGTARPEKTDCIARCQPGFGTAKAVIASRAVTVHASTPGTLSRELSARA